MRVLFVLILAGLVLAVPVARAELVVVANPRSGIERLSEDDVINVFLGRYRRLPSGIAAEPVDIGDDSALRARFYRILVNKIRACRKSMPTGRGWSSPARRGRREWSTASKPRCSSSPVSRAGSLMSNAPRPIAA